MPRHRLFMVQPVLHSLPHRRVSDELVCFLRQQVERAINTSTSRAARAAVRAPERRCFLLLGILCKASWHTHRRVHAIHDNWEELRRGEASFQQVEPRSAAGAGPTPRRQRTTQGRLQRHIMVAAARAASARSARSGRPAPPVSDPVQQAARARAAELLRRQRQGGADGSKRAREVSDEDDDVPLAQRAARRGGAGSPAATRSPAPNRLSQTSQVLRQLYSSMGVRGPAPDSSDQRLAALARGTSRPP